MILSIYNGYEDRAFELHNIALPCKAMFLSRKCRIHACVFLLKSQFRIKSRTVGARNDDVKFLYLQRTLEFRKINSCVIAMQLIRRNEKERERRAAFFWEIVCQSRETITTSQPGQNGIFAYSADRQSIKVVKLLLFNQFFICIDSAFSGQWDKLLFQVAFDTNKRTFDSESRAKMIDNLIFYIL